MPEYTIFPLGDQAVTFSLGNTIHLRNHQIITGMLHWLRQHPFPGLLDMAVAYNSITVFYDFYLLNTNEPTESGSGFVRDLLLKAYHQSGVQTAAAPSLKRIPVCYEGSFAPDMEWIIAEKGLTRDAVVALHTGRIYQVYMIGFLPGFPYMAEIDPMLLLPRKAKPRETVEAGSVGIAGVQTGIYPVVSPGGWQIIGRTPLRLFHAGANPPVVLEAGDQVQFYRITPGEFARMNQHSP
jgi:inhibitor of KinA